MGIPVEVKILDQKLIIRTEEDEEYAKKAADYTNDKIQEIRDNAKAASKLDIALLAAMNIAGEYIKTRDRLTKLESKTNRLVEFIDAKVLKTG